MLSEEDAAKIAMSLSEKDKPLWCAWCITSHQCSVQYAVLVICSISFPNLHYAVQSPLTGKKDEPGGPLFEDGTLQFRPGVRLANIDVAALHNHYCAIAL